MDQKIRVGIIGASPERSWAARTHIPALRALPEYELTAVATSQEESATTAARAFGARHAFTDPRRLAEADDVDLVVVAVKVPAHHELVATALAAGKHVHCEWPLARTTAEAEALVKLARDASAHTSLGLQARYSPVVSHARQLLAEGYLGEVTAVTAYSSRFRGTTNAVPAAAVYVLDQRNGAGTLEVAGGHTFDTLAYLFGGVASLSAALTTQRSQYVVAETGEAVIATSPDNVLVNATLDSGVVLSTHIQDGRVTGAHTRIEIAGTEGSLTLESHGPASGAGIQIADLRLLGARVADGGLAELPTPETHRWVTPDPGPTVRNVAQLYRRLAEDIRTASSETPDFEAGLRLHQLLDAIHRSATAGTHLVLSDD